MRGKEEEEKVDKIIPPLPEGIEKPELPEINPNIKHTIDSIFPHLNKAEIQYAIGKLKEVVIKQMSSEAKPKIRGETIMANPVMEIVMKDQEKCEKIMTIGYPELPIIRAPRERGITLDTILDYFSQRIDPLLQNPKIQSKIANLLDVITKKLEGGK